MKNNYKCIKCKTEFMGSMYIKNPFDQHEIARNCGSILDGLLGYNSTNFGKCSCIQDSSSVIEINDMTKVLYNE